MTVFLTDNLDETRSFNDTGIIQMNEALNQEFFTLAILFTIKVGPTQEIVCKNMHGFFCKHEDIIFFSFH